MRNIQLITLFLSILISVTFLTSCGGSGGDNENSTDPTLLTGYFLDSAVEGLEYTAYESIDKNGYRSIRMPGVTDRNGKFYYKEGEYIQFTIGGFYITDYILGKKIISPNDQASEVYPDRVLNIASFLQTLDNDANPENGIKITEAIRTQAASYTVDPGFNRPPTDHEAAWSSIILELTSLNRSGTRSLVSYASAENHLNATMQAVADGTYVFENEIFPDIYGSYAGTYTIDVSNCSNSIDNGEYNFSIILSIYYQNESGFQANATGTTTDAGEPLQEHMTLTGNISASGDLSGESTHTFVDSEGAGTFTGQVDGGLITITNIGADTLGDTCTYVRQISVSRSS